MSLAREINEARKARLARWNEAARRVRAAEEAKQPAPPPPRRRIIMLPPELLKMVGPGSRIVRLDPTEDNAKRVLTAVANATGVSVEDILIHRRWQRLVTARQIAMWCLLVAMERPKVEWVSAIFSRDHQTILFGWRAIETNRDIHRKTLQRIGSELGLPLHEMDRQHVQPPRRRSKPKHQEGELDAAQN